MPAITALKIRLCLIAARTAGNRSTVTPPLSGRQPIRKSLTCSVPEQRMMNNPQLRPCSVISSVHGWSFSRIITAEPRLRCYKPDILILLQLHDQPRPGLHALNIRSLLKNCAHMVHGIHVPLICSVSLFLTGSIFSFAFCGASIRPNR